jgi:hypothetical protein
MRFSEIKGNALSAVEARLAAFVRAGKQGLPISAGAGTTSSTTWSMPRSERGRPTTGIS